MEPTDNIKPAILLPWRKPDPFSPPSNQVKAAFANSYLDHLDQLHLESPLKKLNLTNIVATIGERNDNIDTIKNMLKAGMNIARIPIHSLNFGQVEKIIKNIKQVIEEMSLERCFVITCAIAVETKGTQMRLGELARPSNANVPYFVILEANEKIVLTADHLFEKKGTAKKVFVDSLELYKRCHPDDCIYLAGRKLHLRVDTLENNDVLCVVTKGGNLYGKESVTVKNVSFNTPTLSELDKRIFDLVVRESVDMIIMSSVRGVENIQELRNLLGEHARRIMVIAKIETLSSLDHIDEIIKEVDGIILDRTSLLAATDVSKTFLAQKIIAPKCIKKGKPFIVGKQVLEDFNQTNLNDISSGDISDVTSIVQLGADAVLLSQSENDPARIEILRAILNQAESVLWERQIFENLIALAKPPLDPAHSIAISCVQAAFTCQATAIIVITCSGYSAQLVSRYKPHCSVLAVSTLGYVCRQLNLQRNVKPLHYIKTPQEDWAKDVDCRVQFAIQYGLDSNIINPGDPLVIINGWRKGAGFTNIMRVVYAPIDRS